MRAFRVRCSSTAVVCASPTARTPSTASAVAAATSATPSSRRRDTDQLHELGRRAAVGRMDADGHRAEAGMRGRDDVALEAETAGVDARRVARLRRAHLRLREERAGGHHRARRSDVAADAGDAPDEETLE